MLWQYVIVFLLVAGALGYLGRVFWQVWVKQTAACHCGTRACRAKPPVDS